MIKTNSIKAWILAARPKTLSAAAVPVLTGAAFAWKDAACFQWTPAILCLLFAWVMQIDSNFVNDYFDFKHGNDDENRLGPKRACAEGWITLKAMRLGILVTTSLGCALGLPLILYGGLEMIWVGIACVVFCFLYTTTLSYIGLGDALVLMFFGIVPVCCSYYVIMPAAQQGITGELVAASIACGLVVDTLLVVNNYRDRANDQRAGKRTLIVFIGERNAELFYQGLGYIGLSIMLLVTISILYKHHSALPVYLLFAGYGLLHAKTYGKMKKIHQGKELNQVLGMTARNIFIFGLTSFVCIIWASYC